MEPRDPIPGEIREHAAMLDRILANASREVHLSGEPFIVWGIIGAVLNVVPQLIFNGGAPRSLFFVSLAVLAFGIVWTILWARRLARHAERWSNLDVMMAKLCNTIWMLTAVMAIGATTRVFANWASAAIWSFAWAIALVFAGWQGNRIALYGGIVLALSVVAANLAPLYPYAGYVLAAGMLLGMSVTGVLLTTQRRC
ncbi:MAG: hypothetical protein JOZ38_12790 [Candidatus Eremiobacteraeota bacterium]|nr:hypothetical protein [Candidatus Eremiobacteraeota bacterium]